nr:zinc finger, CCHC-type [Tanacetum cinerariifolium]
MGDKNLIRTLRDYSKPSHKGYKNTIELPVRNNEAPLRSDTIRLLQNGCSFHGLRSEDPNQHLKDFLKLDPSPHGRILLLVSLLNSPVTIEELAQYEDEGWNDLVALGKGTLDYENPNIKQLLWVMECKVDTLMKEAISLMGRSENLFGMTSNTVYPLPSELSRQEEFEDLVMNFILNQEEKVRQLEEYMCAIGSDFMQLSFEFVRKLKEEIRIEQNRTKKIKKITREVPSFKESKPQLNPLPNYPSLDVSLGKERGSGPPIKPLSSNSFGMKVVDLLMIHTPLLPHLAFFHLKDLYCYHHPCIDDPKKHYGFKPGLIGHSGSLEHEDGVTTIKRWRHDIHGDGVRDSATASGRGQLKVDLEPSMWRRRQEDYFKPSHEGYRNTIELLVGNNMVPLRSDTIRLLQNGCSFQGLLSEDPNQHLKDFLKLVDSLDFDGANKEITHLRLFQFSLRDQASNWLERLLARSISTWEDLTTRFLSQFFPSGRTAKLCNDILMFQQHQGESLSETWTRFKDLLRKFPHHGIDLWIQVQIFYDRIDHTLK